MHYEWDEAKRKLNLQQHGINFADLNHFFEGDLVIIEGDLVIIEDDRYDYGEMRLIAFGLLRGYVIVVAYTERSEAVIRLISARKASKYETEQYYRQITN